MELPTLEYKRAWVKGLAFDCPFGKALDTCLTKEIRKLGIADRIDISNSMDENQLDQIIAHHQDCLLQREESLTEVNS